MFFVIIRPLSSLSPKLLINICIICVHDTITSGLGYVGNTAPEKGRVTRAFLVVTPLASKQSMYTPRLLSVSKLFKVYNSNGDYRRHSPTANAIGFVG